ncbi:MAG: ATP-binding protein, partial [Candidatus Woesebacteria bacterium]|nr:ATP-binding protein [Candidatus Woesebacteria bacterium]
CGEKNKEGIQLDYKRDLPSNLPKHIVAFANTRGGIIIIGVEEDKKTGVPVKWEGIKSDAKLIEKIWQLISNITPLPGCEVWMTDSKADMSFILIRILEGSQTPYYAFNDSNLWVRTGNVSNPIDIASPDYAQLLFKNKESAKLARDQYVSQANNLFEFSLKNADRERKLLISEERTDYERRKSQGDPQVFADDLAGGFKSKLYPKNLGSEASMCTILVQPFYPSKALLSPSEIKEQIISIRDLNKTPEMYFPDLNMKPVPQGLMDFEWGHADGNIDCHQIYSAGLIYSSEDVLRVDRESGNKLIYLAHIMSRLFQVLKAASNFY